MADGKPYDLSVSSDDDPATALEELKAVVKKIQLDGLASGQLNELVKKIRLQGPLEELQKAVEVIRSSELPASVVEHLRLSDAGSPDDEDSPDDEEKRADLALPDNADVPALKRLLLRLLRWEDDKGMFSSAKIRSLAMNIGWTAEQMKLTVGTAERLGWVNVSRHHNETPEYGGSHVGLTKFGREKAQEWADDEELQTTGAAMGIKEDCDELLQHLYMGVEMLDDDSQDGSATDVEGAASALNWPPLRINRAIEVLAEQGLIEEDESLGSHPYRTATINLSTKGMLLMEQKKAAIPRTPKLPSYGASRREPSDAVEVDDQKVFIVYGRNVDAYDATVAYLEKLGLRVDPFHHEVARVEPSGYVGEAIATAMKTSGGIIVLMTPDEYSTLVPPYSKGVTGDDLARFQPRPNVIFEAGMALGAHRTKTVIVVIGSNVRTFSDIIGRHIVYMNNSVERREELRDKLQSGGCRIEQRPGWHKAGDFEGCVRLPEVSPQPPFPKA